METVTQAAKAEARKAERASADRKAGGGNEWWERKAKAEEKKFEKADWLDESRRIELIAERRGILSWIKARRRKEARRRRTMAFAMKQTRWGRVAWLHASPLNHDDDR